MMAHYELEWSMQGRAAIEADDADEAERILHDGLSTMDSSMMDEFDVDETTTDSVEEVEEQ